MKTAIIHYWLTNMRGGEKIIEILCDIFPHADIFTLAYNPDLISKKINRHNIQTSFIQNLPFGVSKCQQYLPLHPFASEQFDLSGYDLVISSESGISKGIILDPFTCHICYCHSPMRYLWNMYHEYKKGMGKIKRILWAIISNHMRQWDYINSQRVDYFIANSKNVRLRIKKYYNKESEVIYPPVEFSKFKNNPSKEFYLFLGQLNPYKKADLAVRAFNKSNKKLTVIGDGPQKKELKKIAGSNIKILGKQSDSAVVNFYSKCKGLVFPGEEDFGITPLEAMASGKPVIAYRKGGALETVIDGKTGILFDEQNEISLLQAINRAEKIQWNFEQIRDHAKKYDTDATRQKLNNFIINKYNEFQSNINHSAQYPFNNLPN